jgi:D-alanine-D-alanine ligase
MGRLRLAVIFGGNKQTPGGVVYPSRNTRSWKSYEAVASDIADSLRRLGFRHVHLMPDDLRLGDRLRRDGIHMAWLNTGGIQGYNPTAHASAMLEMSGVPYVGHDPLAATTLDNKHAFKREALCAGLPTAPFVTWHMSRGPFRPQVNSLFRRAFGDYAGPVIVKPVSGRASLHVHVVDDVRALPDAVAEVYSATENVVLIEKFLPGREFCIAVAGPVTSRGRFLMRGDEPFTFAALERVLAQHEKIFTSMDLVPITAERCRPVDPQVDAVLLGRMRKVAGDVFREFNLGTLVRLDLRTDAAGDLFILEANPKPDLKRPSKNVTSLIAEGLPEAGMDYDDLILSLFADRLDFLMAHRRENIRHITDLLLPTGYAATDKRAALAQSETTTDAYRQAVAEATAAESNRAAVDALAAEAADSAGHDVICRINEVATKASLQSLGTVSRPDATRRWLRVGS